MLVTPASEFQIVQFVGFQNERDVTAARNIHNDTDASELPHLDVNQFQETLDTHSVFVARHGTTNEIIGIGMLDLGYGKATPTNEATISYIAVARELRSTAQRRGLGVGRVLLQHLELEASSAGKSIMKAAVAVTAVAFYEKNAYTEVGIYPGAYIHVQKSIAAA